MWKHEIQVPAGFEAAVNHEITSKRPLYVGAYDQVHFVSLAPNMVQVTAEAKCREGIPVKLTADIRLEIPKASLGDVLKDSGYSTYSNIIRVQVGHYYNCRSITHSKFRLRVERTCAGNNST